ncbi:MAG: 50S ribosomal protein L5 [Planctomycetes bacterium]|nr:50S ribosomal protein L5 [Planctomycetota bacterium]
MAKGKAKKKKKDDGPIEPAPRPRLAEKYDAEVRKAVMEQFGTKNPMAAPCLEKITINVNMGRHLDGTKIPPNVRSSVIETLEAISGQRPIIRKAKKSVSNFKVREGYETSAVVTLRRDRMWHFLDRLINLATPRIKDFRGLSTTSFDGQGNYSFGLTEQGVFPEINMAEVSFTHGMNINLTFSNSTPERSAFLLAQLGMPFKRPEQN